MMMKTHQVMIRWGAVYHEYILADVLLDLGKRLPVRERFEGNLARLDADHVANTRPGQVRTTGKNFHEFGFIGESITVGHPTTEAEVTFGNANQRIQMVVEFLQTKQIVAKR